jgi:hypothetical protein
VRGQRGVYIYHALLSLFIFFIQPFKMDMTEGSETSAKLNLTPRKYPKENIPNKTLSLSDQSLQGGVFELSP